MDETQDKVRRNLVVASTLLVLFHFFDVNISKDVTISVFTISGLVEWKVWGAVLLILLYIFQRYWFDGVTGDQRTAAWNEFKVWRNANVADLIRIDTINVLNGYCRSKFITVMAKNSVHDESADIGKVVVYTADGAWPFRGKCNGHVEHDYAGITKLESLEMEYRLSKRAFIRASMLPAVRSLTFAKGNADFLIPMYLFVTALSICVLRLAMV
ncbi:hypothetical protein DBR37_16090 [Herminiimonas sp. KBW02]|uniref:hypothetical protein n=1 Tax=Herminiimonas sp. KBW02 TaxID=2153363 RepID=UPI000F5A4B90|nr:hypothetical protein [Herminiimonas sp. KBW02]RQO32821.1 hypothetical protein DBR37_16090 [Herminiimonas sp. KBW02]